MRVEAIRFAYSIFEASFQDAEAEISKLGERPSYDELLKSYRPIWEMIDFGLRFVSLCRELRGFKKPKCLSEKKLLIENLTRARNVLQHLTTELRKLPVEYYPAMGAITLVDKNCFSSKTVSLGGLAKGTKMSSAALDRETMTLVPAFRFDLLDVSIDLLELKDLINAMYRQFDDFIHGKNWFGSDEAKPSVLSFKIIQE